MKQLLLWLAVLSLLVVPPFAAGSDLDDLKAFSEKGYKAWNSLDAEAIVSMHLPPGAIVMEADSPFPSVQTKENAIASIKAFF